MASQEEIRHDIRDFISRSHITPKLSVKMSNICLINVHSFKLFVPKIFSEISNVSESRFGASFSLIAHFFSVDLIDNGHEADSLLTSNMAPMFPAFKSKSSFLAEPLNIESCQRKRVPN